MIDIKNYDTFKTITAINKGWSNEKKYFVETITREKMLLRIADISRYDRKKYEFEVMKRLAEYEIPMSLPIDFGICDNGKSVYTLLTWCEGEDAEILLPRMTEAEQYTIGVKSGHILREIHKIPAPDEQEEWEIRFNRKASNKIESYKACGIKIENGDKMIDYIEGNRHLLDGRPQCFQHGDYHVGNMIISPAGELSIIDFGGNDYGDPWEEFNRIVWSASVSPHFATGQLNGYFDGRPPMKFFKLLAFYMGSNTLSSIPWTIPFGEDEVDVMKNKAREVLTWFDQMKNPVPTWYLEDFKIHLLTGK